MGTETGTPAPEGEPAGGPPAIRASDAERYRVVELLGEHAAAGRLTLAELEERVQRAYAASTRNELAELTRDLPDTTGEVASAPSAAETPSPKRNRWFFAIMGGSNIRQKQRLNGTVNMVAIMGGDELDLREVQVEGNRLVINCFSLMGGAEIYVPDTLEVEITGTAIMGGNEERGSTRPARPGAPVVHVRSIAIMGGVTVWRLPAETRGMRLKRAKQAAKALERGQG
ncbi:MAG TPA: DUF1707 domain-containing protein [Natronosporangium sp.]|nr:DUF1707 domain-containing protein [Natronosporangium sp.]